MIHGLSATVVGFVWGVAPSMHYLVRFFDTRGQLLPVKWRISPDAVKHYGAWSASLAHKP